MGVLRGGVSAAADPDDLFALCDVFAERLDAPVAIEDADFQVVAYSSGLAFGDDYRRQAILQRHTTAESLQRLTASGLLTRLRSTSEVIALDKDEFLPRASRRLLVGVHDCRGFLGVIWACADDSDWPQDAQALLKRLAELAVPGLSQRQVATAGGHDEAARLLRRALEASDPAGLAGLWELPADTEVLLAGVEPAAGQRAFTSMVAVLRAQTAMQTGRTAVTCLGSTAYLTVVADGSSGRTSARAQVTAAVTQVSDLTGAALLTALADPRPLHDLTRAYDEVRRILRVLRHPRAPSTTAGPGDVGPLSTLLELADVVRDRPHLHDRTATRLAAHDRTHGTEYVETVRALLEEFGDIPAAARRLCLHPNSYRYRLRRLQELFTFDLRDPDARLVLQLQLRLAAESTPEHPARTSGR